MIKLTKSFIFLKEFGTFLLILLFLSGTSKAEDRIPVATVNGKTIWLSDVMEQAERLPASFRQTPLENYFDQLVSDMIDAQLAAAAARKEGFEKKKDVMASMKVAADRVLAEAWISDAVTSEISEESVKKAYQTFVADTASRQQVTASHILVDNEDEANSIIKELLAGADFADLAKSRSTGPSGPNGGSLGTFGRGQMVPAFETAAFALDDGDFSKTLCRLNSGGIIKVEKKEITQAPTLDQMRNKLIQTLSTSAVGRVIEELRAGQNIQIRPIEDIRRDTVSGKK